MRGIVAGQMGVGLSIAEVVDGDDLDVIFFAAFVMSTKDVAADAAIAINCNTDSHGFLLETKIQQIQNKLTIGGQR